MSSDQIFGRIPTLQTARLTLRPVDFGDEEQIYNICLQPEVQEFTNVPSPYTLVDAKQYVAKKVLENLDPDCQDWRWAIVEKENNVIIGGCGLRIHPDNPHTAVIGYAISKHYWGQALTPEAVNRVIRFGFENISKIEYFQISHHQKNLKSGRVAQKLGFKHDGNIRGNCFLEGVPCDSVIYSLSKEEWQNQQQFGVYDRFKKTASEIC